MVRTPTLTLNINMFFNYVSEYCNISEGVIGKQFTSSKEQNFFKQFQLLINKISRSKKKKNCNFFYFLSDFNLEGFILFHLQFHKIINTMQSLYISLFMGIAKFLMYNWSYFYGICLNNFFPITPPLILQYSKT